MSFAAPRSVGPVAASRSTAKPTVCIVDPGTTDYEAWTAGAAEHGIALEFIASGAAALRRSHRQGVTLWIVNAELSDLAGVELCAMLRQRNPQAQVYLVSNAYSTDFERQAYMAGAQMYGAKPAHCEWLGQWRTHRNGKRVASHLNLASGEF